MYLHGENENEKLPAPDISTVDFRAVTVSGKTLTDLSARRILRMTELNSRDELFLQEANAQRIEALKVVARVEKMIHSAKFDIETRRAEIDRLNGE